MQSKAAMLLQLDQHFCRHPSVHCMLTKQGKKLIPQRLYERRSGFKRQHQNTDSSRFPRKGFQLHASSICCRAVPCVTVYIWLKCLYCDVSHVSLLGRPTAWESISNIFCIYVTLQCRHKSLVLRQLLAIEQLSCSWLVKERSATTKSLRLRTKELKRLSYATARICFELQTNFVPLSDSSKSQN